MDTFLRFVIYNPVHTVMFTVISVVQRFGTHCTVRDLATGIINITRVRLMVRMCCGRVQSHTGQCLRRIAGGNVGLPLDTT